MRNSRPLNRISNSKRKTDSNQSSISSNACSRTSLNFSSKLTRSLTMHKWIWTSSNSMLTRKHRSWTLQSTTKRRSEKNQKSKWFNCLRKWWLRLRIKLQMSRKRGKWLRMPFLSYSRTHAFALITNNNSEYVLDISSAYHKNLCNYPIAIFRLINSRIHTFNCFKI